MAPDILTVLGILIVTVCLLIFEVVRIDVTAILCMLALGWSGVLTPQETLAGFASNAVIAMMAVMIMGRGIAKTGIMDRFSRAVLAYVGTSRHKTIVLMSLSVGLLSAFIQNIGAAALFLPSILDVSRRGKMPASSLIMPVGFAAILGGTLSMVGSGPLIVINDLLRNSNLEPYGLLDVTPAGVLLLGGGILFFLLFGTYVLPSRKDADAAATDQEAMISAFHLPQTVWHYAIPATSPLIGQTAEQSGVWQRFNLHILGLSRGKSVEYAPWRQTQFEADQQLALLGDDESINRFAAEYQLTFLRKCQTIPAGGSQ